MRNRFPLSVLALLWCAVLCGLGRPVVAGSQSQAYADLEGTIQHSTPLQPDAGAHVYLIAGEGDPVNASNLAEVAAKAFRHADADAEGRWWIGGVYPASYRVVFVSAHEPDRIFEQPVVVTGTDHTWVLNHVFESEGDTP